MIEFKKLKVKNFMSVGSQPIELNLNTHQTTAIMGSNGSGKSSLIIDAIHFALFGKPFRNINIPNVINSINSKECVVELWFSNKGKEFHIIRGLKPKILEVFEDGKMIDQDASAKDYQRQFEVYALSGMNDTAFKQIVVLGSAQYQPFMQLSAAARREVIEDFLDIKIFSSMSKITKDKLSLIKETLTEMDNSIELHEAKIKMHETNIQKNLQSTESKRNGLLKNIQVEEENIKKLMSSIESDIEKKEKLESKIDLDLEKKVIQLKKDADRSLITFENENSACEKVINFFHNKEECPTCMQSISKSHKDNILSEKNSTISLNEEKKKDASSKIEKFEKVIEDFRDKREKVSLIDKDIFRKQTEVSAKTKFIQTIQKEIKVLDVKDKTDEVDIKKLEKSLKALSDKRLEILETRRYYEIVQNLLKDGGIKTKIIRQYIPLMNKLINMYLERFGLPIEFTLDEQFNEVIKSRYKDKFQYNNFSEGEKQRIDLAILLTWRHIAKNKNTLNTNLLIFDEVFDKSLDTPATEELLNILLEMEKQNIFVISHKLDLSNKLHHTLRFEKVKNFTKIV